MAAPDAEYFDDWYSSLQQSPREAQIVAASLGLPPGLESTSLLPWAGIAEVLDLLTLSPGDLLVDLGCGRGGYGLEFAQRSGAALVGVDFSAVAIRRATDRAKEFGIPDQARFVVGDLAATGLEGESADAIVCVDAVQFADPPLSCIRECFRVLRPGGRVVLTSWEAVDRSDDALSQRLRNVQLQADLSAAGFVNIRVEEKPEWRAAEFAMWTAAVAETIVDDPGLQSLQDEGSHVLATFNLMRRVCGSAVKPS